MLITSVLVGLCHDMLGCSFISSTRFPVEYRIGIAVKARVDDGVSALGVGFDIRKGMG